MSVLHKDRKVLLREQGGELKPAGSTDCCCGCCCQDGQIRRKFPFNFKPFCLRAGGVWFPQCPPGFFCDCYCSFTARVKGISVHLSEEADFELHTQLGAHALPPHPDGWNELELRFAGFHRVSCNTTEPGPTLGFWFARVSVMMALYNFGAFVDEVRFADWNVLFENGAPFDQKNADDNYWPCPTRRPSAVLDGLYGDQDMLDELAVACGIDVRQITEFFQLWGPIRSQYDDPPDCELICDWNSPCEQE